MQLCCALPHVQIEKKLEPLALGEDHHEDLTKSRRPLTGCTIFLGYTSNLISSGIRETIRYLVQHNMVSPHYVCGLNLLGLMDNKVTAHFREMERGLKRFRG